jgi:uncharacterized protein YjbI with pentapeptide repeats
LVADFRGAEFAPTAETGVFDFCLAFAWVDLVDADLVDADLVDADFVEADLVEAALVDAALVEPVFVTAVFADGVTAVFADGVTAVFADGADTADVAGLFLGAAFLSVADSAAIKTIGKAAETNATLRT